MASMDDAERELLTTFYTKYARRVYERCMYFLRNEEAAQDAMHDTFIKAQKNLNDFRGDASPLTWLTRIATNHCLNLIRARKAQWHAKYRQEVEVAEKHIDDKTSHREITQLIRLCLTDCEKDIAEIAIYYFVDEMTQQEIANATGVSLPTVRKRLRAFIEHARAQLEKEMPGIHFRPSLV